MKEARRYLKNAKEILLKAKKDENEYRDAKPVQEAYGTAYLAALKAIDEFLISRDAAGLPQTIKGYQRALNDQIPSGKRGKITKQLDKIYKKVHVVGYYRGGELKQDEIEYNFRAVEDFIENMEDLI